MGRIIYDFSKLRGRIVEKFGTQVAYAEHKGWSPQALNRKLQNAVRFMPSDIDDMCEDLDIEVRDIGEFFFTKKVQ